MYSSTTTAPGFSAVLTAEAPICGSGAPLVASNQSQVVTSPAHPAHYPASVSCEWVVDAGSPVKIYIFLFGIIKIQVISFIRHQ